jgi:hypothetical protein
MATLAEIQAAAKALRREDQEALYRILGEELSCGEAAPRAARIVRSNGDVLLEAPPDAPPMTPEHVKALLETWP